MDMTKWVKYCFWVLVLGSPRIGSAQLSVDTIHVYEGRITANLNSTGDTVDWFTSVFGVLSGQTPYFTSKLDSLGNALNKSTFGYPSTRQAILRRIKIGNIYHTMRLNVGPDTLAFYQSTNDSTLGTMVSFVLLPNNWTLNAFSRSGTDEIVVSLDVETLVGGSTIHPVPIFVRYIPSTGSLSSHALFDSSRIPMNVNETEVFGVSSLSNNRKIVSCYGCRPTLVNGNWEVSSRGDLVVYDQNFQFVTDTILPNPAISGPFQLTAVKELVSGNFVFMGRINDTSQLGQSDLILSKWSPQLQQLSQVRFGNPDRREYFRESTYIEIGYDGFLYTFTNVNDIPFWNTYTGVYVCKFDTNLNLIDELTIQTSEHLFFEGATVNRSGVYFSANTLHAGIDRKVFLYRIRNSGVGVGASRPELPVAQRVYPNPVQELLYWEAEQESQRFVWYDMQGRKVREEQLHASQRQEIAIDNLAPGIYLLQAFTPDGRNFAPQRVVVR